MVSKNTQRSILFAFVATGLWVVTGRLTDSTLLRWGLLVGVGVILPTILAQRDGDD
ncbi:hypothetical protein [Halosegnis longus]|uniref:hypothetical protein n=1 Tax=Halosegnis longus TaxID=2216012 RepID=UPI0015628846|nr:MULTISPECIES: hypothetical protein [Halobacteriales]